MWHPLPTNLDRLSQWPRCRIGLSPADIASFFDRHIERGSIAGPASFSLASPPISSLNRRAGAKTGLGRSPCRGISLPLLADAGLTRGNGTICVSRIGRGVESRQLIIRAAGTPTVADPELETDVTDGKQVDSSGPRIRCPLCGWEPKRLTAGCVPAGMSGTHSTRAASARHASISGLQRPASRVTAGRHIRIGMSTDESNASTTAHTDGRSDDDIKMLRNWRGLGLTKERDETSR
jgi:hypothetical protein